MLLTKNSQKLKNSNFSKNKAKYIIRHLYETVGQFAFEARPNWIICRVEVCHRMQQSRVIQFIFRYKLHHIPFWIVYHLVWLIINFGSLKGVYDYLYFTDSSVKFYFYLIFQMLGVYFNLYYLIPKFLYRRRFALYLLLVVATILACNAIITSGYYVADWLSPMTFEEMYGVGTNEFFKISSTSEVAVLVNFALIFSLSRPFIC